MKKKKRTKKPARPNYITRGEANDIRMEAALRLEERLENLLLVNVRGGYYGRARGIAIAMEALDGVFFAPPF